MHRPTSEPSTGRPRLLASAASTGRCCGPSSCRAGLHHGTWFYEVSRHCTATSTSVTCGVASDRSIGGCGRADSVSPQRRPRFPCGAGHAVGPRSPREIFTPAVAHSCETEWSLFTLLTPSGCAAGTAPIAEMRAGRVWEGSRRPAVYAGVSACPVPPRPGLLRPSVTPLTVAVLTLARRPWVGLLRPALSPLGLRCWASWRGGGASVCAVLVSPSMVCCPLPSIMPLSSPTAKSAPPCGKN
jgi:hypothetical protein